MFTSLRCVLLILGLSLTLAGCTGTPVAITYPDHSLTGVGASSSDQSSFSFLVSDDHVSCRGSYNLAQAFRSNFSFPITCSDGLSGRVEVVRMPLPTDKAGQDYLVSGKVIFSDGKIGMFNLGQYARNLNVNSISYQEFIEDLRLSKVK